MKSWNSPYLHLVAKLLFITRYLEKETADEAYNMYISSSRLGTA